ncbi:MAG TPA: EamA family transporter, partial [Magnetovibrio sp.]
LIWGSTWYAITLQLGVVDPVVSVAYRFAIAALFLLAWCWVRGKAMRYALRAHGWMALQGLFLFCANYAVFYIATGYVTSGLVAVVFSTIAAWNLLFSRLFFATPVEARVLVGAVLGIAGLSLVFWPQIEILDLHDDAALGLLLCIIATVLASFGNMASSRNQRSGLPVLQSNAFGMAYGALFTAAYAAWTGRDFLWDASASYLGSLLYLSLFGSVLAFGAYLTLLGRIGAGRAAYAAVLFPVVALSLSVALEGYAFTPLATMGAALVLGGNVLVLARVKHFAWVRRLVEANSDYR